MMIHQDPEANHQTNNTDEEQQPQQPKTNNDYDNDNLDGTAPLTIITKAKSSHSRRRSIIVEYSKSSFHQIRGHISRVALMSILCSIYVLIMIYNEDYFRTNAITELYYHPDSIDTGFQYSVYNNAPSTSGDVDLLVIVAYKNMTV